MRYTNEYQLYECTCQCQELVLKSTVSIGGVHMRVKALAKSVCSTVCVCSSVCVYINLFQMQHYLGIGLASDLTNNND